MKSHVVLSMTWRPLFNKIENFISTLLILKMSPYLSPFALRLTIGCQKCPSTRKSSCMNAGGIPPAVYQALHLLSYSGGEGYGISGWGYLPHLWTGGTPSLDGGGKYPISGQGYPIPGWVTSFVAGGTPPNPDLAGITPPQPVLTWPGYTPPPPRCGLTN